MSLPNLKLPQLVVPDLGQWRRNLDMALGLWRTQEKALRSLAGLSSSLEVLSRTNALQALGPSRGFLEAAEASRSLLQQAEGLGKIGLLLNRNLPTSDLWVNRYFSKFEALERSLKMANALEALNRWPTDLFKDSLALLKAAVDTLPNPGLSAAEVMKLPNAYLTFADRQLRKIGTLSGQSSFSERDVASAVLDYAGSMYAGSLALLGEMTDVDVDSSNESGTGYLPPYNIYGVLNRHCARFYAGNLPSSLSEIGDSLPAKIHRLGMQLVDLVLTLNAVYSATGRPFFKPTTCSMRGVSRIPNNVAADGVLFADIVDHLYFTLYENSGDGKRLLDLFRQDHPTLEPLWHIKHLRNFFRHDLEHGKDAEGKLQRVSEIFESLTGAPRPLRASDWKRAQLALYARIVEMLDQVLVEVSQRTQQIPGR